MIMAKKKAAHEGNYRPNESAVRSIHVASEGAASSLAPSYDLAFKKNRTAASALPARVLPHPSPSPKTNGRTDLPSSEKTMGHPEGGLLVPPWEWG